MVNSHQQGFSRRRMRTPISKICIYCSPLRTLTLLILRPSLPLSVLERIFRHIPRCSKYYEQVAESVRKTTCIAVLSEDLCITISSLHLPSVQTFWAYRLSPQRYSHYWQIPVDLRALYEPWFRSKLHLLMVIPSPISFHTLFFRFIFPFRHY